MILINRFVLALLLCAAFNACKKNDDPVSRAGWLVNGKWQITETIDTWDSAGHTMYSEVYTLNDMEPCERDNYWIFDATGKLTGEDGALKCDLTDPQTFYNGTWALLKNDTQLRMENEDEDMTIDIVEASESRFKMKWEEDAFGGGVYTSTITFQNMN